MIIYVLMPLIILADGSNRTGFLTRNRNLYDCMVWTVFKTFSAVDALGLIYMGMALNGDSLLWTIHLTRSCITALAGIGYHVVCLDTGIACFMKDSKHRPCRFLTGKGLFGKRSQSSLFINIFNRNSHTGDGSHSDYFTVMKNTAAKGRFVTWNHFPGNEMYTFLQFSFKLKLGNTYKDFPFYIRSIIIDVQHISII